MTKIVGYKGIKKNVYGKDKAKNHFEECAICFIDFKDKDQILCLNCSELHFFHRRCIIDWLKMRNTCPLCNAEVEKADKK